MRTEIKFVIVTLIALFATIFAGFQIDKSAPGFFEGYAPSSALITYSFFSVASSLPIIVGLLVNKRLSKVIGSSISILFALLSLPFSGAGFGIPDSNPPEGLGYFFLTYYLGLVVIIVSAILTLKSNFPKQVGTKTFKLKT